MNASRRARPTHPLTWVLVIISLLHAALLFHDLADPEAFLRGDRSYDRLGKTSYVFDAQIRADWVDQPTLRPKPPDLAGRMVEVGPPGDYLVAGALLRSVGQFPLIVIQTLLTIGAAALVYAIGRCLRLSPQIAAIGALIFSLLPGTIVQAHLFVAEAWAIPSLALAIWATLQLSIRGPSTRWLLLALGAWSLAVLFRTQFAYLPFALVAVLCWQHRRQARVWMLPLLLGACLPFFAWNAYTDAKSDAIDRQGVSITEIGYHLRKRLDRVQWISGEPLPESIRHRSGVTLIEFIEVVGQRPGAYLRTVLSDNADYLLNPGTVYLSRYLGVIPEIYKQQGWGVLRDRGGVWGTVAFLFQTTPLFALLFTIHAGLSFLAIVVGCGGLLFWGLRGRAPVWTRVLVLGVVAYNILIIQLAYQSRWSLRQPNEVIAAPFLAYALAIMLHWLRAITRARSLRALARDSVETDHIER